jgi:hypothetical protein
MSLRTELVSDHQLARMLQIGLVLEEVVEARAAKHATEADTLDSEVRELLEEAETESARHRERVGKLVAELDAETVDFEQIQELVEQQYEADQEFDGILYDQLCNEETAYKFYDDLIEAIESSEVTFSIDRDRILDILEEIRAEEKEGVEEVTELMEQGAS